MRKFQAVITRHKCVNCLLAKSDDITLQRAHGVEAANCGHCIA